MSKMTPIGYQKTKMGYGLVVFFFIIATVISVLMVRGGLPWKYTLIFYGVAAALSILCVLSDITTNIKYKDKYAYVERMLSCPYVWGKYVETRQFGALFNNYVDVTDSGTRANKYRYRIVVSFTDPNTNEEKEIFSEFYARRPERECNMDRIKVHYSEAGEYWIDLAE